MNTRRTILACVALLLCGCQPSVLCDPGQYHMGGGCYPNPKDSGSDEDLDAGDAAAADGGDAAMGDECPGDPYDGFGVKCTGEGQCSCHAPQCAPSPLGYCTKLNCDLEVKTDCPPDWTCLMIPPGVSPDPSLKTLCIKM
ncbi:MAG TPA: hypothetical protein VJV78_37805 [Polyangiales bacterium]|nr:hypothetical protein [Polyangiales bacterium]